MLEERSVGAFAPARFLFLRGRPMCVTAPQFFGPFGRIRLDFSTLAPAARHDPPLLVNLSCLLAVRGAAAEKQVRLIVDAPGTEENGMSSLGSTLLKHVQDARVPMRVKVEQPLCCQDLNRELDNRRTRHFRTMFNI